MRVLVVNEPELAEAIERLRGEWAERAGGTLSATSQPWDEFAKSKSPGADLVIFPTRYLGELCVRRWLRPMRGNVLEGPTFDAADVFPVAREDLVSWGGPVMAVPLGVNLPTEGLLVEAASAAVSSDRLGVLFDPETMKPRITEPAFVEALVRLEDSRSVPGAVPVLGTGDRLVGVTTASRNAASAFKLAEWLASSEISTQLASAVGGMSPVRRSLSSSPAWIDASAEEERGEFARRIERSLTADRVLLVPRIPGIDQYLAALDEAVRRVKAGEAKPQAVLQDAAAKWEAITDSLGRVAQRSAYRKHLGIDEP